VADVFTNTTGSDVAVPTEEAGPKIIEKGPEKQGPNGELEKNGDADPTIFEKVTTEVPASLDSTFETIEASTSAKAKDISLGPDDSIWIVRED